MERVSAALFSIAATGLVVSACGSSPKSGFTGDGTERDASASPTGNGGTGTSLGGEDAAAPTTSADAACASAGEQAVSSPVNLYIMFDKSSSQVGTKWDSARAGLEAFLNEPSSAGVRVAINFFPRAETTQACDATRYRTPRVPFGVLPGNAAAVAAAVQQETPNGSGTPIWPALGGAILGAYAEAQSRPGDSGAVLLVTDGEPSGPGEMCSGVNPELTSEIAKIAKNGLNLSPSIRTFVIGLPGVVPTTVNQIAAAGGTAQAYIVATTSIQADFQKALAQVRGQALPCEFELPPKLTDKTYSYDLVNVGYTAGGATSATTLPQSSACAGEGWRYDDAARPSRIVLCPSTCARVKEDYGAKIDILLGCATVLR